MLITLIFCTVLPRVYALFVVHGKGDAAKAQVKKENGKLPTNEIGGLQKQVDAKKGSSWQETGGTWPSPAYDVGGRIFNKETMIALPHTK
jgi:hypothetical protein